jgi:hypothetical protein
MINDYMAYDIISDWMTRHTTGTEIELLELMERKNSRQIVHFHHGIIDFQVYPMPL